MSTPLEAVQCLCLKTLGFEPATSRSLDNSLDFLVHSRLVVVLAAGVEVMTGAEQTEQSLQSIQTLNQHLITVDVRPERRH